MRYIIFTGLLFFVVSTAAYTEPNSTPINLDELPAITVISSPLESTLLDYGSPVTVINKNELETKRRSNLGDTLSLEPGVSSNSFGPGAGRPVIRGFSGDRVRVLKNGIGTGDVSSLSEDHVVSADPLQTESIEILRGPETLLYGSNAIGGTVNTIDNSIPEMAVGKTVKGEVLLQGGNSADEERSGALSLKGQSGAFNWQARGFYRQTEDLKIPGFAESARLMALEERKNGRTDLRSAAKVESDHDHEDTHTEHSHDDEHDEHYADDAVKGRLDNSATLSKGASVGGSYIGQDGFLGVSITGFSSNYGVPGHAHSENEHEEEDHGHSDAERHKFMQEHGDNDHEENVKIKADEIRMDIKGALDLHDSTFDRLKFALGVFDYEHKELEGTEVGTIFKNKGFESRLEALHRLSSSVRGTTGTNLKYSEFSAVGDEAFVVPVDTIEPGVFSFHSIELNKQLNYEVGGRAELVSHDAHGRADKNFVPFSLATGPVWKPFLGQDYLLGLSVAYTQRAPAPVELYADGAHLARQIYEVGDDSLGKESALGADLTFRKSSGTISGAATSFVQKFDDYINLAVTEAQEEGFNVYQYKATEAVFWGFELESSLALHDLVDLSGNKLFLDGQFDYVRARDTDNDNNLARIQPVRTITRLRQEGSLFSTALEAVFVEQQDWTAPLELSTKGYALLNANIDIPVFKEANQQVALFVSGTNLTDEEARLHTSFLKDIAPLRGRAFLLGLKGSF